MSANFPNIPEKYISAGCFDEESQLYTNFPATWSASPYLGAISRDGGYVCEISPPVEVWRKSIQNNQNVWPSAPDNIFYPSSDKGDSVAAAALKVVLKFKDPRQAAFVYQETLYSGRYDLSELFEEYLTLKYNENLTGFEAAKRVLTDVIKAIPSFSGEALQIEDRETFFDKDKRSAKQKEVQQNKNVSDFMQTGAHRMLSREIEKAKLSSSVKRSMFGRTNISKNEMLIALDKANEAGELYNIAFKPNSIRLKDFSEMDFKRFT